MLLVNNLRKTFNSDFALKDVKFHIKPANIVSLVGQSGSGKTTVAMCIAGLLNADYQEITLAGKRMDNFYEKENIKYLRGNLQVIFQNSRGTLHPRKKIGKIFEESTKSISKLTGKTDFGDFYDALEKVNMPATALGKYPKEFSGGECQRIAIARALIVKPKLLIADEALSSSDVTTQAKILNLLKKLRDEGLSILFITHDIAAAHYISDRIVVMHGGSVIENGECKSIIEKPQHFITKKIIKLSK